MALSNASSAVNGSIQEVTDVQEIYRLLKRGLGHEWVNDVNVFELMELAQKDGHALLEEELREWQSPCRSSVDKDVDLSAESVSKTPPV